LPTVYCSFFCALLYMVLFDTILLPYVCILTILFPLPRFVGAPSTYLGMLLTTLSYQVFLWYCPFWRRWEAALLPLEYLEWRTSLLLFFCVVILLRCFCRFGTLCL
jgi:hypothetical protein